MVKLKKFSFFFFFLLVSKRSIENKEIALFPKGGRAFLITYSRIVFLCGSEKKLTYRFYKFEARALQKQNQMKVLKFGERLFQIFQALRKLYLLQKK